MPPKLGPEPTLVSRKEVDALYETLGALLEASESPLIVTGGSLLGAVRQRSILFCDDDVDVAFVGRACEVQSKLDPKRFQYQVRPWPGGDRIRPRYRNSVFVDVFELREYKDEVELREIIGEKENGKPQSEEYVQNILETIFSAAKSDERTANLPLFPMWHFNTRKAVELWPKEVYRECELFPLSTFDFGPLTVRGPRMPVLLLERAFGKDCFEVYYPSNSHKEKGAKNEIVEKDANGHLPPLLSAAGQWENNPKQPLLEEHYIPMQPISRSDRKDIDHDRERLFGYLSEQRARETKWLEEILGGRNGTTKERIGGNGDTSSIAPSRPRCTVYMDGVFDLFHVGHLKAIQRCAELGDRVIVGVTGDVDAAGYKRPPVIPESERTAIVASLKDVDEVVCPCPLVVDEIFMAERSIDLVVHGFCNDEDAERQREFFQIPMDLGKFQRIGYYHGQSTTDIIEKIQQEREDGASHSRIEKPQWFGATLAAATNSTPDIPFDPFPLSIRQVIEPHITKAAKKREESLGMFRQATGESEFDQAFHEFRQRYGREVDYEFDVMSYPLRSSLLKCCGLNESFDLTRIHEQPGAKDRLLREWTSHFQQFQTVYDSFVREVCAFRLAADDCDVVYYQAFPCLRVVQPNEFSIGPHADCNYGHMPCSINVYVPLTPIRGTSALYLESRPGAEDWHPIQGDYGSFKQFAGAICMHWTTENKLSQTRVSLDFRLIPGKYFDVMKSGPNDVYRAREGYYASCSRSSTGVWERNGGLPTPDARIGYPWTVKDWAKEQKKREGKR